MTGDVLFPCRWDAMPDPRARGGDSLTVIEVGESEWRKIVQKHFADSTEPWGEIVTAVKWPWNSLEEVDALKIALVAVRNECLSTLRKPLVLLYSCVGPSRPGLWHRWLLVLPSGALALIWCEKEVHRLKTCYFTDKVSVYPRAERWRGAIEQQIQEFGVRDDTTGAYLYPSSNHRREVDVHGGTSEMRCHICFSDAVAWGFSSDEPGSEWHEPRWSWDVQQIRLGSR